MIHQYKLGGYNVVLDVCSGSVHVVDEVAYDIIGLFETNDRETILRAMAEKYAGRGDNQRAFRLYFQKTQQGYRCTGICFPQAV